ncbi:DUF4430 domain-containing protein [bacterium]|nr:DUF4430 domain-containing protein [bacterium]
MSFKVYQDKLTKAHYIAKTQFMTSALHQLKQLALIFMLSIAFSSCDQLKDMLGKKPVMTDAESVDLVTPKFVQQFNELKDQPGIQIALVIDPKDQGSAFFEIVSFDQNTLTAYDVLEKAHIEKQYHPGYKKPEVLVLSLNGVTRKKINGRAHDWAFFYLENKQWKLSPKGIGNYELKDGDMIGFSFSSWKNINGEFKPEKTPLDLFKQKP